MKRKITSNTELDCLEDGAERERSSNSASMKLQSSCMSNDEINELREYSCSNECGDSGREIANENEMDEIYLKLTCNKKMTHSNVLSIRKRPHSSENNDEMKKSCREMKKNPRFAEEELCGSEWKPKTPNGHDFDGGSSDDFDKDFPSRDWIVRLKTKVQALTKANTDLLNKSFYMQYQLDSILRENQSLQWRAVFASSLQPACYPTLGSTTNFSGQVLITGQNISTGEEFPASAKHPLEENLSNVVVENASEAVAKKEH